MLCWLTNSGFVEAILCIPRVGCGLLAWQAAFACKPAGLKFLPPSPQSCLPLPALLINAGFLPSTALHTLLGRSAQYHCGPCRLRMSNSASAQEALQKCGFTSSRVALVALADKLEDVSIVHYSKSSPVSAEEQLVQEKREYCYVECFATTMPGEWLIGSWEGCACHFPPQCYAAFMFLQSHRPPCAWLLLP